MHYYTAKVESGESLPSLVICQSKNTAQESVRDVYSTCTNLDLRKLTTAGVYCTRKKEREPIRGHKVLSFLNNTRNCMNEYTHVMMVMPVMRR